MHPNRDILKRYAALQMNESGIADVEKHLENCELCREFCDYYKSLVDSMKVEASAVLSQEAIDLRVRLFSDSVSLKIINLAPLTKPAVQSEHRIAADTPEKAPKYDFSLATLCSENPEAVLRLMHDPESGKDYLHLISDDERLSSGALVCVPEVGAEFLTDQSGRALIDRELPGDYNQLHWQIRIPDAVFALEPLKHDLDSPESCREIKLQTALDDEVAVKLEGTHTSLQIAIRIVKLAGKTDFGHLKVVVSQKTSTSLAEALPERSTLFNLTDPDDAIAIRLYK